MLHKKRKPSTFTSSSGFADCKRNAASNNNMLHSKSTYFYRWNSLVPSVCGLALLFGLGIMLNPVIDNVDKASAATTNILTDSNLGTKVDLIMGDVLNTSETVESGKVAYISNSFSVKVEGRADYHISVQAAEGYGSELTGRTNKEKITGVGSKVSPANFGDNTWGYALETPWTSTTPPDTLSYNTLPAYGTLAGPQYSATDVQNKAHDFSIHFAAKITNYKPVDHYETQALLSVVANAKTAITIGGITKMSQMTSAHCKSLPTPNTDAKLIDIPTGQLIDDRANAGGQKYWVSKLADGNCWMTQNMMYDTDAKSTTYKNKLVDPSKTTSEDIGAKTPSDDSLSTAVYPSESTYNSHYQIGNYYDFTNAATVCTSLGESWKLPASNSNDNGTFGYLMATKYGIQGSSGQWTKVKAAPLYFVAGGYDGSTVGAIGYYWSSTSSGSNNYYLRLASDSVNPTYSIGNASSYGFSVRCVVSGE